MKNRIARYGKCESSFNVGDVIKNGNTVFTVTGIANAHVVMDGKPFIYNLRESNGSDWACEDSMLKFATKI